MERFRTYIGKTVDLAKLKEAIREPEYGLTGRYIPDPPEDFDEFELVTDWSGHKDVAFMITVEIMRIKRMFFGLVSSDNPDLVKALSAGELKELLDKKGHLFIGFLDRVTDD